MGKFNIVWEEWDGKKWSALGGSNYFILEVCVVKRKMGRIQGDELPGHGLGVRSMAEKYQRVKTGCVVWAERMGTEGLLGKPHGLEKRKAR